MTSYFVKSKGQTLDELAADGNWGFIKWAAFNMKGDAKDEAFYLFSEHCLAEVGIVEISDATPAQSRRYEELMGMRMPRSLNPIPETIARSIANRPSNGHGKNCLCHDCCISEIARW